MGKVGSIILLSAIYAASLILMTGLRPIHLVHQTVSGTRAAFGKLHQWRVQRQMRNTDIKGQLEISKRELAKQRRSIEKQLKKKGAAVPGPAAAFISPEELANRPAPKVVDTTALPEEPVTARKKPSLAELRGSGSGGRSTSASTGLTSRGWDGKNYALPGLDLLNEHDPEGRGGADPGELQRVQQTLIDTLGQFGIAVAAGRHHQRADDHALRSLSGQRRAGGQNRESRTRSGAGHARRAHQHSGADSRQRHGRYRAGEHAQGHGDVARAARIRRLGRSERPRKVPLALGKDVYGKAIIADLAQMPHLLVAGTTGSGKSVCINALVASMLFRFTPEELRFIMIDPKVVELQHYNALPHLAFPVVTDPKKVLLALRWLIDEMERRYKMFARVGVRNIISFNARPKKKDRCGNGRDARARRRAEIKVPREDETPIPEKIPYIVVMIDELADLMQTAPADVESAIARITQMARAAGIHLIVATQTPRADVITGVIKANIPSRIAFQVASKIDSRVILDENGADRLLGQGDMLYLPPSASRLIRAQGVLVTDEEIRRLVEFVSAQGLPAFDPAMHEKLQAASSSSDDEVSEEDEELVEKCIEIIRQEKRASTSLLADGGLRLGYTRAARIVDILEQRGILGPGEGAKPREILVDLDAAV